MRNHPQTERVCNAVYDRTEGQLLHNRGPSCCGRLTGAQTVGFTQWQIQCQIRGIEGIRGDRTPNKFSKLLIRLILPPGSNPSLSDRIKYLYAMRRTDALSHMKTV
jgi:hypothetical protein